MQFLPDSKTDRRDDQKGKEMKEAILVDANEVKKMLAEKFQVPQRNIIKAQYSYTVIMDKEDTEEEK